MFSFVVFYLKDGRKREIYKLFIVSKDHLKAQVNPLFSENTYLQIYNFFDNNRQSFMCVVVLFLSAGQTSSVHVESKSRFGLVVFCAQSRPSSTC